MTERVTGKRHGPYVRFSDGTTFPHPERAGEVEHTIRYGKATDADLSFATSVLSAYRHMLDPIYRTKSLLDKQRAMIRFFREEVRDEN